MRNKMTIAILGLGNRGLQVYAPIIQKYPDEMELLAVADIEKDKVREARNVYHIDEKNCFYDAESFFEQEQLADALFICTQDRDHVTHAVAALEKGYHILLEKPISPTEEEYKILSDAAKKYNRIVCVCHVLRYTPFYSKIKELILNNTIRKVLTIQAREDVGYFHQAHSFVRGNWRKADETSPMILAKSCHDMDIFVWLANSTCRAVSSFGNLSWFKQENAPEGAADHCFAPCPVRENCPFDAEKIYITNKKTGVRHGNMWPANSFVLNPTEDNVRSALQEGPYGKCVYKCDNTVVDHQVVNLEMDNDITITFSMCAFTEECNRMIKIMGTQGEIKGDMGKNLLKYTRFGEDTISIDVITLTDDLSFHGGGDSRMVYQFCEYVMKGVKSHSITEIDLALESHYIALAADKSRISQGQSVFLDDTRSREEGLE